METGFLKSRIGEMAYTKWGSGNNILLCFHGYSHSRFFFTPLVAPLADGYTIYSFDLFFHGDSNLNNERYPLEKSDIGELFNSFLVNFQIDKFSVLGFSIGSRFALSLCELFPGKINKLILLAPDAIKENFWYKLSTGSPVTRRFFKSLIDAKFVYSFMPQLAKRMKWIDEKVYRFVNTQLDTKLKREKVYHSWLAFRKLAFNKRELIKLFKRNQIEVFFITGKFDHIIKALPIIQFCKKAGLCNHYDVPAAHGKVLEALVKDRQLFFRIFNGQLLCN